MNVVQVGAASLLALVLAEALCAVAWTSAAVNDQVGSSRVIFDLMAPFGRIYPLVAVPAISIGLGILLARSTVLPRVLPCSPLGSAWRSSPAVSSASWCPPPRRRPGAWRGCWPCGSWPRRWCSVAHGVARSPRPRYPWIAQHRGGPAQRHNQRRAVSRSHTPMALRCCSVDVRSKVHTNIRTPVRALRRHADVDPLKGSPERSWRN